MTAAAAAIGFRLEAGRFGIEPRRGRAAWWVELREVGGSGLALVNFLDGCRTRTDALALARARLREALK